VSGEAFYSAGGGRFVPSELTRGPWDPDAQHAGPPAALLGRAIGACEPRDGARVARIAFEILGPVPLAPLAASARVVRPGRGVELLEGSLRGPGGEVMRALAWRLRTAPVELDPPPPADPAPPGPADGQPRDSFPVRDRPGYHSAMEFRFVHGGFLEIGPAMVWMRPRVPLVAGEPTSPLERLLIAADAGNGVSATLDWRRYLFINTDLSVHVKRLPRGDWVGLDAVTYPEPDGIGLADTALWDEAGRLGRAAQTLVVRAR
jgi:hypothetical protein